MQDLSRPNMVKTLATIKRLLAKHSNGGRAFTNLIPGATDLTFYSRLENKPVCLGFTPARLPPELKLTRVFHGVNECLPVEGFKWGGSASFVATNSTKSTKHTTLKYNNVCSIRGGGRNLNLGGGGGAKINNYSDY